MNSYIVKFAVVGMLAVSPVFTPAADAQVKVKSASSFRKLGSVRTGSMPVYVGDDGDVFVTLLSHNRFDKVPPFSFGKTKESALQTIDDLLELASDIGRDILVIEDAQGREWKASKASIGKGFSLSVAGMAGSAELGATELKRIRQMVEEKY